MSKFKAGDKVEWVPEYVCHRDKNGDPVTVGMVVEPWERGCMVSFDNSPDSGYYCLDGEIELLEPPKIKVEEYTPWSTGLDYLPFEATTYDPITVGVGTVTIPHDQIMIRPEVVLTSGGPSSYYDLPESVEDWKTLNDVMEYLSEYWQGASLHFKDIFKAGFRWGRKGGTTKDYDARKIAYSGLRLLTMVSGKEETRKYLQSLLDDKQFGGKGNG